MRWRLCIWVLFLSLAVHAQEKECFPVRPQKAYSPGERFTLSLMYKWGAVNTEVAKAWVSLDSLRFKGHPSYETSIVVRSAPFFDIFFPMRENFSSTFDAASLRPYKFVRDTKEGNYIAKNLYLYDWDARVIHADVEFEGRASQTMDIPLRDCVYDLPTLVYYVRNLDVDRIEKGVPYPLSFAIDDAVFDVRITFNGSERVKVRRLGSFQGLKFSCSVVSGAMFEGDQQLELWLSDDDNRLPLAINVPLRVGAVKGWLKEWSGLKYPLTAKL